MAMTSRRSFPTQRSCSFLGPPAITLCVSDRGRARAGLPADVGTIQEKKHLDRREMNEDGYLRLKKNKGRCGKSRKSRRREIISVLRDQGKLCYREGLRDYWGL